MNATESLSAIRRELYSRLQPAEPSADPLSPAEQAETERLLPIAHRVARKVARQWHYPASELESVAAEHLVDAVRLYDGRGTLEGFTGQWCRWRLLDYVKHRRTIAQIEKPLPDNRQFKRRGNTDRRPDDFRRNLTDVSADFPDDMPINLSRGYFTKQKSPLYGLMLAEAAALVRHNLDSRDVEILGYRLRGWRCADIGPRIGLSARRVQEMWDDIERSLKHHAGDELDPEELAQAVLETGAAAEKFQKFFRAF
jgi:hypothetical protein